MILNHFLFFWSEKNIFINYLKNLVIYKISILNYKKYFFERNLIDKLIILKNTGFKAFISLYTFIKNSLDFKNKD